MTAKRGRSSFLKRATSSFLSAAWNWHEEKRGRKSVRNVIPDTQAFSRTAGSASVSRRFESEPTDLALIPGFARVGRIKHGLLVGHAVESATPFRFAASQAIEFYGGSGVPLKILGGPR